MHADIKGSLKQIDKSYKAFEHNGLSMTKQQVKDVLEYALSRGYEHTGQLSAREIDSIIGYPKGTTKEQWDRYYEELKAHEERVQRDKPTPHLHSRIFHLMQIQDWRAARIYKIALSQWEMMRSCDAPNKPGYFRANND